MTCDRGRLAAACLLWVLLGPGAVAAGVTGREKAGPVEVGHSELVIEVPRGGALPSEMLKLHVRSTIRGFVAMEDLRQPALVDLDWKQLGPDMWSYVMEKGLRVNFFERTMAIYPQRAGHITVEPFVHHLTLVNTSGVRGETELRTNAVTLDIRPSPRDAPDWWLPASSLTITDSWDKRPDRLSLGETARRTVVIEAVGVGVERLPPPPKMRAPGIISFAAPAERSSHVSPDGPHSRAVYRWDVRPVSADAAILPAVEIPWFDTLARRNRIATIPERLISLAGANLRDEATGRIVEARGFSVMNFLLAAVTAFVWGIGAIWLWRRFGGHTDGHPALRALRRAARRGDARAFKAALLPLSAVIADTDDARLRAELAMFDRHLFGRGGEASPPLSPLYRAVARAVRRGAAGQARAYVAPRAGALLLPLDGAG